MSSGQTFFFTENKATAVSVFQMYEFHGTQQDTRIHPGQTFDLDYSVTQVLSLRKDLRMQIGLVGYGQWQTREKTGPTITPAQAKAHYRVNALGLASNVLLPERRVSVGIKFFREFSNRSTFQGTHCRFQARSVSRVSLSRFRHAPHPAMCGGLFELQIKAAEGIARVFYCTVINRRIVFLHQFIKKTDKSPPKELNIARQRMNELKHG